MAYVENEYDSKEADYILRESVFNLKGNIDLLAFGILDEMPEDDAISFIKKLKDGTDSLYTLINTKIVKRANKIQELNNIIKKDLSLAKKIQENILPKNISHLKNFEINVEYRPLVDVGGDFYDIFEISPGYIRVFLADATGHGVQAALTTMLIKSEYEKYKQMEDSPSKIMEKLNYEFANSYRSLVVFFTGIVMDIDTNCGTIRYSSAGHPPQHIIRKNECVELPKTGKIVGVDTGVLYDEKEHKLKENDKILLFTDGIYEEFNENSEEYGYQRLYDTISSLSNENAENLLKNLNEKVEKFRGDAERNDDIALILIEPKLS